MSDDGGLEASMSSASFFSQADSQTLQSLKDKIKMKKEEDTPNPQGEDKDSQTGSNARQ